MAETKYDLISIGGATWDSIITADDTQVFEQAGERYLAYPYAKKVYMDQAFFGFGGGAANVAVSASRLGLKTAFVGAVGSHHVGNMIVDNFDRENVSVDLLKRDDKHRTGLSVVLTAPDGERTILLYRGANNHLSQNDIDWPSCTQTEWLYVSSLSGESDKLYDEVAALAKKEHVKLALNPGATQIKRGTKGLHNALEDCMYLGLNEEEARELLRQRGEAGETVREMLGTLQSQTGNTVVITRGIEGAEAYDGSHYYHIDAFSESRVNTIGSGDAFNSTFVVAMQKKCPIDEALRLASINAASVVSDYGAQTALLHWDELTKRAADASDYKAEVTG